MASTPSVLILAPETLVPDSTEHELRTQLVVLYLPYLLPCVVRFLSFFIILLSLDLWHCSHSSGRTISPSSSLKTFHLGSSQLHISVILGQGPQWNIMTNGSYQLVLGKDKIWIGKGLWWATEHTPIWKRELLLQVPGNLCHIGIKILGTVAFAIFQEKQESLLFRCSVLTLKFWCN